MRSLEFCLNYIDYELFAPTALDQDRRDEGTNDGCFSRVPIIRIFGRTDAGQNVCALVHGVFPYMFVEYAGLNDAATIRSATNKLAQAINISLSTAFRRNPHDDDGNQFVASIRVCKAVPFYGLHTGWRLYYKISLLSPKHMTRLADLFRQGSITGAPCQPFESQLPYLLQFMIDFNMFGCGVVSCRDVAFRQPLPTKHEAQDAVGTLWSDASSTSSVAALLYDRSVDPEHVLDASAFPRTSHSAIEIDVIAAELANRDGLRQKAIHFDIQTEGARTARFDDRILTSLTELWREDAARRQALGLGSSPAQLMRSGQRVRQNTWTTEEHNSSEFKKVVENNKIRAKATALARETFPEIRTTFEDVQHACDLAVKWAKGPAKGYKTSRAVSAPSHYLSSQAVASPSRSTPQRALPLSACKFERDDLRARHYRSRVSQLLSRRPRIRGGGLSRFAAEPPAPSGLTDVEPQAAFPAPYYKYAEDVPQLARQYGLLNKVPVSHTPTHLPPFPLSVSTPAAHSTWTTWRLARRPPTLAVLGRGKEASARRRHLKTPHVRLPTQNKSTTPASQTGRVSQSDVPLSILSIEMHARAKSTMLPNPSDDPVLAIFWSFKDFGLDSTARRGIIVSAQELNSSPKLHKPREGIAVVGSELDLLNAFIDLTRSLDPDVVISYEIQNSAVGYLNERAKTAFSYDLCAELGRALADDDDKPAFHDRWGETHATSVKIQGRHVLNLWRTMRSEMNLLQYTLENVCFHLLNLRTPKYAADTLHRWLTSTSVHQHHRALDYYANRTDLNIRIVEHQGLLARVSEQARLLGIDFYSVFSRGSQFKVESLMFRIAKPECFMMMAPSRKQVAQQNALECLPLVMEPQSSFYNDPVVVLDFQSLYPSIMIAYNFCYSTCLGKLGYDGIEAKLGVTHYAPDPSVLLDLQDDVDISPNGVLFAREGRRRSLLAKMLRDLLETRAMVKEGAKLYPEDAKMQKLMHNRQLALKLIANVTYGYTSASFSGRMPCADIADSIVQTGRETLENAIEMIHGHERWRAEVVYGDTDSLFIKLPGRSKANAFTIGREIAEAVTQANPSPIKLKFEKVYLPCVLLAKKRYVGFKYESPTQTTPGFDAKGIETVRRDGTPAEQKIEENVLKTLFRTGDLSAVKDYFQEECWKIMTGQISLHDFCFAKEVKLGTYSTKGVPPPGAVISAKSIARDPRSEPQYGERIPYVVTSGSSKSRLVDRCVTPEELLLNPDLRLDVEYYITKNLIPPLDRIFALMGVNVKAWYDEMPRSVRLTTSIPDPAQSKTTNLIEDFLGSSHCPVCRTEQSRAGVCETCAARPAETFYDLQCESRFTERTHRTILQLCSSCANIPLYNEVACISKDCPAYYRRVELGRSVRVNLASALHPSLSQDVSPSSP